MKFIENDCTNACEVWIGLDHTGQDALCDDFDPRGFADLCVAAHSVADSLAYVFS